MPLFSDGTTQNVDCHFEGGLVLPVSSRLSLTGDVRYVYLNNDFNTIRGRGDVKSNIKMNTMEAPSKEQRYRGGNEPKQYRPRECACDSETRYRRLFEAAKDGILILDADSGAITDANPYIIEILGYSPEDLIGKRLWEIGAFFDIIASRSAFEELQRKEYIRYDHLPLQTKDGQMREVEFISNVYEVDLKKVIQCNIRSISERKRAEDSLRESEERYRRLFETAQDGILLLDAESGAMTDANPFLTKMLGYDREELIGRRLWEVSAFKDWEASMSAFEELQRKGYIRYENLPLETKDGQSRQVEFVSNVYLVNGKKVIQCNIRDITRRKWLEEDKQKLMNKLQEALSHIKELKGLLPICCNCKKIRNDKGYWQVVEGYIIEHTDATFTHGVCPDCMKTLYPDIK
ncbi:MAG: PAS domain S-box protein [Ignavibacteriae bacterium]|nr:MAG: PAS domain S-box protein [Ignavibacteriota bacterium]